MIKFENLEYKIDSFNDNDIFVCALGYEVRSLELYKQIKTRILSTNILAFVFDDYQNYDYIVNEIDEVVKSNEVTAIMVKYDSEIDIYNGIKEFIRNRKEQNITIHIDYSAMPRRWYCRLPFLLRELLEQTDKLNFWYALGHYPGDYEAYPSAGIDSFSVIGKSSLRIWEKRMHVVGLSYDAVRTRAMISILDPDAYITCNAYNEDNKEISTNVRMVNEQVISRGNMEVALQISDFSFMISRLCEIANESLPLGDVILVPDGPKPLIFAMSLVPQLLDKVGVTCLHVSRNKEFYSAINVEPTGKIYGFSVIE